MGKAEIIEQGIYLVGGSNISHPEDAAAFIIDFDGELVMIDAGAGQSSHILQKNIEACGLNPQAISTLILTHCHIDHIGSAPWFREQFGCRIVMHEKDSVAVENGDPVMTAANWYETTFPPTRIDRLIHADHEILCFGKQKLHCVHVPGHTPGSIVVYIDRAGKRILFGQDIHGPFMPSFRSNIEDWKKSMHKLLDIGVDILCEGHFGIFQPRERAENYIRGYLRHYA